MINFKILLLIWSMLGLSLAPEKADNPYEYTFSPFNCSYRGPHSDELITAIYNDAKNGNSVASYYLFFGAGMIKGHGKSFDELLQLMVNNHNPAGYEVRGTLLFEREKYDEGLFYFQMAAEQGHLGAISKLIEIYAGEKYPSLKDVALEVYWSRREALSGNIYNLKKYIVNNPENLSELRLIHWQKAYEILIQDKTIPLDKNNTSEITNMILFQINENRNKLGLMLKNHHPWHADYKYCKK